MDFVWFLVASKLVRSEKALDMLQCCGAVERQTCSVDHSHFDRLLRSRFTSLFMVVENVENHHYISVLPVVVSSTFDCFRIASKRFVDILHQF